MTFKESIETCLLQKYLFVFKGRASRAEFWWFMLFIALVNIGCGIILQFLPPQIAGSLSLVISLLLFPANLGVTVRRLHDRNMRGWWLLVPLLTLLFWAAGGQTQNNVANLVSLGMCLCYLIILCMPGQEGPNRFGEAPASANTSLSK